MESETIQSYLQRHMESKSRRAPDNLSFENPHSCDLCENIYVELSDEKGVICCNECRQPFHRGLLVPYGKGCHGDDPVAITDESQNWTSLAVKMNYHIPSIIEASENGCKFQTWILDAIERWNAWTWIKTDIKTTILGGGTFGIYGTLRQPPNVFAQLSVALDTDTVSSYMPIRSEHLTTIDGWTTSTDVASSLITARPYEHDVKSAMSMEFARSCLEECVSTHRDCRRAGLETDLFPETTNVAEIPTRLIRTGVTSSSDDIALVDGAGADMRDICAVGFVALSYCWGGEQPFRLTAETSQELKTGIQPSRLPQTLQDAIFVCRALNIGYLWVDSLCIFQDDQIDKEKEVSRMASYYTAARLTICAASASNCTDGFLSRRKTVAYDTGPFRLKLRTRAGQAMDHIYLVKPVPEYRDSEAEPITKRGWTLQESMMSRRLLIFARKQLYWKCAAGYAGCGGGETRITNSGHDTSDLFVYPMPNILPIRVLKSGYPDLWHKIVDEYTTRELSKGRDKLLAVSALAQYVASRVRRSVYFAGLLIDEDEPRSWIHQLLWHVRTRDCVRPKLYRAPSWSWASLDGPVQSTPDLCYPLDLSKRVAFATVDDAQVTLSLYSAPYGAVTAGHMVMTAKMCTPRDLIAGLNSCAIVWNDEYNFSRIILHLWPDTTGDRKTIEAALEDGGKHKVLMIACFYAFRNRDALARFETTLHGIVVDVSNTRPDEYVRVGCFEVYIREEKTLKSLNHVVRMLDHIKPRTIRIV
ncbi:heterokaryon incompatibility protein-domain-containing protein [Echria macrotheca]|uniref:Heterokaryon incompatibility protein-domain-containing protein n=1 Tax=Echria macrotheca TaxID=438768 RepID=A0AAJ0F6C9_9PEZI|nr:heterokaryon incompatibility protein-domain-containing protein [Echria macrotheca]